MDHARSTELAASSVPDATFDPRSCGRGGSMMAGLRLSPRRMSQVAAAGVLVATWAAAAAAQEATPAEQGEPSEDPMLEEELRLLDEEIFDEDPTPPAPQPPPEAAEGGTVPKARPAPDSPTPELREVTVRYTPEDIFRMGGSVQTLDEQTDRPCLGNLELVVVDIRRVIDRQS